MNMLFILELTAFIFIFYFLLGSEFSTNLLKIVSAWIITILYFVYHIFNDPILPSTFILTIILIFLFEEKVNYTICLALICSIIEMLLAYFCNNIAHIISNNLNKNFLSYIDGYLYIFEIILSFLMRKRRNIHAKFLHEIDLKGYNFLSVICLFSMCIVSLTEVFLYEEIQETKNYFIALLFMLLYTIVLIITSVIVILLHRYNIKLQHINYLKQRCLDLEQTYYIDSKTRYEELKAFRHDFNSHILTLQNLVALKEWDKLENYINKLSIEKNNIVLYTISTGNIIADAIINHFQHSLEKDVLFKINGQFRKDCFVEDTDICIILSNLLNNAHEAFEYIDQTRPKEIYLSISANSENLIFKIENTSKTYTSRELEHLQTTKSDTLNHGFGLANVQHVTEKYNGDLQIHFSDGLFITTVILYKR